MSNVDWDLLLANNRRVEAMINFAFNGTSANETAQNLAFTEAAGEFRDLVRSRGSQYARRLARKAVRRRDLVLESV